MNAKSHFLFFRQSRRCSSNRQGTAVVEFAITLPVIILIVFGAMEAASMLFLRQALVQASYESVKIAARDEGSQEAAVRAAQQVAEGRRIQGLQITFEPSNIQNVAPGQMIRVLVSAPADANSLIPFGIFKDRNVSADAAMIKE